MRQATESDIPAMHLVRLAVRENSLSDPSRITVADYRAALAELGRGYGHALHSAAVSWLWSLGHQRLWLTTSPGNRADPLRTGSSGSS